MNSLNRFKIVLILAGLLLLGGCAGTADKPGAVASSSSGEVVQGEDMELIISGSAGGADGATSVLITRSDGSQVKLNQNVIYFDYDSSELREEFKILLRAHADYLLNNPGSRVTIEGHADERGTREYNLALGENRAFKVKKYLTLQGVTQDRVKTVSFGEEKPDLEGHTESDWSKNRRAIFNYAMN